jgi:hypothetical protein
MRRDLFPPGFLAPVLAGLVLLLCPGATAFAAADQWSHVIGLKKNTEVRVELHDGQSRSGKAVTADSYSMTVRSMGEDEQISRGAVQRVTRIYTRSSAPVVAAAVAAGIAASAAIFYGCSQEPSYCWSGAAAAGALIPLTVGWVARKHPASERSEVVYETVPAEISSDMPTDWGTVRRALPPSLQGTR